MRVRKVTSSSFEFQLDEWSYLDGVHGAETVSYLVVEAGEYQLSSGRRLIAGRTTGVDFDNPRTQTFAAGAFTQTPLVLAQVRERQRTSRRRRNRAPPGRGRRSTRAGRQRIELHRPHPTPGEHAVVQPEDIHWIALEPGSIAGVLSAGITGTAVDEVAEPE